MNPSRPRHLHRPPPPMETRPSTGGALMHRISFFIAFAFALALTGRASADPVRDEAAPAVVVQEARIEPRGADLRVVVELTHPPRFHVVPLAAGGEQLEIRGATLAADVPARLAGQGFLEGVTLRQHDGRVIVEVEAREGVRGTAVRSGRRVVWVFSPPEGALVRPRSQTIAVEPDYAAMTETAEVAAFLSDVPLQVDGARGGRRY